MKTITITILVVLLAAMQPMAQSMQPCLPEGITFYYQHEIDNFQTNHPDCNEIEGDVTIRGWDITNLNGLNVLNTIGGNLDIRHNDYLLNLSGLDNLVSIGGSLTITENISLLSLDGLEGLISINGNININNNMQLSSIMAIGNLDPTSISDLGISYNGSLSSCHAEAVCNYLSSPNGIVAITGNAEGCNSPPEVANHCGISLPCLPFGNYTFSTQTEIDSFQSNYPGCYDLTGDVTISGMNITNLYGLSVVTSIGGTLRIGDSDALTSMTGLEGLTQVGGDLQIGFFFSGPDQLSSLSGLDNLNSIGGNCMITCSPLTNLYGLNNLTSIGGGLTIRWLGDLVSLEGLDSLSSIGGDLWIGDDGGTTFGGGNPSLTSLTGLENIDPGTITSLGIFGNNSLSDCAAQSVCEYLVTPGGNIYIYDNAPGCNSQQEVEEACELVAVDELDTGDGISIYPNPCSGISSFGFRVAGSGHVTLKLYDMHGREVAMVVDGWFPPGEHKVNFDASGLPPGLYLLKVVAGEEVAVRKLVVSG